MCCRYPDRKESVEPQAKITDKNATLFEFSKNATNGRPAPHGPTNYKAKMLNFCLSASPRWTSVPAMRFSRMYAASVLQSLMTKLYMRCWNAVGDMRS